MERYTQTWCDLQLFSCVWKQFSEGENTSQVILSAQHANQFKCENTSKLNSSNGAAKWFTEVRSCTEKHSALNVSLCEYKLLSENNR